jgi:hypothetical protein
MYEIYFIYPFWMINFPSFVLGMNFAIISSKVKANIFRFKGIEEVVKGKIIIHVHTKRTKKI